MAADNTKTNPEAANFAAAMGEVEKKTILEINKIAFDFAADPFAVISLFGKHLIEISDHMRHDYEKKNAGDTAPAENVVNDHQSEV